MKYFLLVPLICLSLVGFAGAKHAPARRHPAVAKITDGANSEVLESLCPDELLAFAQTLIGTRYRSASSSPEHGFDCSGFVNYVFKNFNVPVPRSSYDFASVGERVELEDARPGDVILFTGTHKRSRKIGHVGIVFCNTDGDIKFIHATSGKEHGVTITAMDKTYHRRFVRIVRLLKQNDQV